MAVCNTSLVVEMDFYRRHVTASSICCGVDQEIELKCN